MNAIRDVAGRRLAAAGALALLAWVAVIARLFDVTVLSRAEWVAEAEAQQQRTVTLPARRGALLDREGRELAVSTPAWSAWADPGEMTSEDARRHAARELARVLDIDEAKLRRRLEQRRAFVWIQRKLTAEQRESVRELQLPGVGFVKESQRVYPNGSLAAHALGVVGMDGTGLEGLEVALEDTVAGEPGLLLTTRDARGDDYVPGGPALRPGTPGSDVITTLDAVIQHVVERELKSAVARSGAMAGTAVVMFPLTGDIAALSNYPTFNPNNFPAHPSHLRTNRALASCYEPGSTLKMFTAAAALEAGVTPRDVIDCGHGSLLVGRTRVRDHEVFDRLSVADVLAKSSNIGAIQLGRRAGAARLHDVLDRFGFGAPTGAGAGGESAGILRPVTTWTPLSLASISFGQEVAVTPIQLCSAASAIAAGGVMRAPRLVRAVVTPEGLVAAPSRPARRVISEEHARALVTMLEGVVVDGTGRAAAVPGYRVAGKTGTAQKIGDDGKYADGRYVSSFVGWAPANRPAFVALVILDEPKGAAFHGGDVAAPAFAAMARDILRYLQAPPDEPGRLIALDDEADRA